MLLVCCWRQWSQQWRIAGEKAKANTASKWMNKWLMELFYVLICFGLVVCWCNQTNSQFSRPLAICDCWVIRWLQQPPNQQSKYRLFFHNSINDLLMECNEWWLKQHITNHWLNDGCNQSTQPIIHCNGTSHSLHSFHQWHKINLN